ncbi:MAG: tetratricopeptide repeat protein [Planctomycetota bacterium]
MLKSSRLTKGPRGVGAIRRAVFCGVLIAAVPSGLGVGSAFAQGMAQASAQDRRDASHAYETGLLLHREGEFEAAVELFYEAIGHDPALQRAYAALTDAQMSAARNRLLLAIRAADEGDLVAARRHAERALAFDGDSPDIRAAAQSFEPIEEVLSTSQQQAYAQAKALADDRSWRLARERFEALIESAPLYLPARAAHQRAAHFENRAIELGNQGAALMQQHRLGPAVESLAAALAIWPYHPDASALAEQAQAKFAEAEALATQASDAHASGELEQALALAQSAATIDRSHEAARRVVREAQRGLADRCCTQGDAHLESGDFAAARAMYAQAFSYVGHYPDARRGMAKAYLAQGEALLQDGRPGAALLAFTAGQSHDRGAVAEAIRQTRGEMLSDMDVTLAIHVPEHAPAIGVDSAALEAEFDGASLSAYMARADEGDARYAVEVRINDTDVELRRTRTTQSAYGNSSSYAVSHTQWEKRGTLDCTITVTDTASGEVVRRWSANRWVSHTDRQQYVVGSTWQRSYWTLPSDDEIEARLARDLVGEVWPDIRAAVTLARARALRDQAQTPPLEQTPEETLELRVAATLLAGQINEREGEVAIRELARAFAAE